MIANVKATEGVGDNVLKKKIHEGSESIMFSVLQETQYIYPFKSSVREIVSNSLDSISEKKNALKILNGDIEIEDLFIEKEGEEFKDSRFNADYYDTKWLSDDNDVKIRYIENDTDMRDRIQFIDHGVGLGGDRLVNYFSLGFSSKRLSKSQLGSFGLGAKSLLATGVDSYSMTTRYNGKEFQFDIFKDHVVSTMPKFNDDGSKNPVHEFYNGYKCHYRETKQLNKVLVEAEVKRHRRQDYINAVESQLGFIDNIQLLMSDKSYGIVDKKRDFSNTVVFKTDKVLVGDTDYYARPQILLKPGEDSEIMINYGVINFDELEMKRYAGNVSFIMNINDVDVTPSRESVIWNTKTRDAIKNMFVEAQEVIKNVIKEKLSGASCLADHFHLLEAFKAKNSVAGLGELYKVIDSSDIDITYRTFNIAGAGTAFKKKSDDFLMAIAGEERWGNNTGDVDYKSNLSKKYLSFLSPLHNNFKRTVVYIGDTKYKGIGRYARDAFNMTMEYGESNVNVIYMSTDYADKMASKIGITLEDVRNKKIDLTILNKFIEKSYKTKTMQVVSDDGTEDTVVTGPKFEDIIIGEVFLSLAKGLNVLFKEEIDSAKMKALAKKVEEAENDRWLTAAEKAKKEDKVSCKKFYGNYSYKDYYNEDSIKTIQASGTKVILYRTNDASVEDIVSPAYRKSVDTNLYLILGCSADTLRRFIKVKGTTLLTDALYNIEFGEISLTHLGRALDIRYRDIPGIDSLLTNKPFADIKIDISDFNVDVKGEVTRKRNEIKRGERDFEKKTPLPYTE